MKNLLLINAHQYYPFAQGKLNKTLFEFIYNYFDNILNIKTTIIDNDYNIDKETDKFIWADLIIVQSPLYWFYFPAKFKQYIDLVFKHGIFYLNNEKNEYGDYGLFTDKTYMFSLTGNTPVNALNNPANKLFNGRGIEDIVFSMHSLMKFNGMNPVKTFTALDVVHNPDIPFYLNSLKTHLDEFIKQKLL